MDPTALIISRLDTLERNREADKAEAKKDRHDFRNEMTELYNKQSLRMLKLECTLSAVPAKSEAKWMKWVMAAQAGVIGFLAWLVFGHK